MIIKLLEKYKANWCKIGDSKNMELSVLPVYVDRYIKTKIRICANKVCTNFRGLNVCEDYMECEFFTAISIDSFCLYIKANITSKYIYAIALKKVYTTE